ncbi:MAG: hypothetical protein ABIO46_10050 [Chitinophagales bacterium]
MKNQSEINLSNDLPEYNEFPISPGGIFVKEFRFKKGLESYGWKQCPDELGGQLENVIQEILVENCEPTHDYSDAKKKYFLPAALTFYPLSTAPASVLKNSLSIIHSHHHVK